MPATKQQHFSRGELFGRAKKKHKKHKKHKHHHHPKPPPATDPGAGAATPAGSGSANGAGSGSPTPGTGYDYRWQDNGDGTVTLVQISIPLDQQPTGPGPRPVPQAQSPPAPPPPQPFGAYSGPFGRVQATRLLNRAGFGPRPGQAAEMAGLGMRDAVYSLTRPSGTANLTGPAPTDSDGNPIAPADAWGHDHLWWLDRMVRSDQQLVERMALIFHDWFATSNDGVDQQQQMIDQSNLFRSECFGSFQTLAVDVTKDPAMLQWLNGNQNRRTSVNENYGRELMELFTLGANRGAYSETSVREIARALTGWRSDYVSGVGQTNFRFDPIRHDTSTKTLFAGTTYALPPTNWNWDQAVQQCVQHPLHPSFFVPKLWSYFVPTPPSADTESALESIYTSNGYAIRPVLEAILMHPDFYLGAPMVKPPVVFTASLLRALGRPIDTEDWAWLDSQAGQQLFWPPNVAGWDDSRWLDTSTMRARWLVITYALENGGYFDAWNSTYSTTESVSDAVNSALGEWDWPPLRSEHQNELVDFAQRVVAGSLANWQQGPYRAMRQNALRHLIAVSPDLQLQ